MDWWEIILGLLAVGGVAFATGKVALHQKIKHLRELFKSLDEAFAPEGPGGGNLTKEELLDIWEDAKRVVGA